MERSKVIVADCSCPSVQDKSTYQLFPRTDKKVAKKETPAIIKGYLMAYNQISFLGWAWILVLTIKELVENDFDYTGVFNAVWKYLPVVQTAAALEVNYYYNQTFDIISKFI